MLIANPLWWGKQRDLPIKTTIMNHRKEKTSLPGKNGMDDPGSLL
jgi:hypothetical protein